MNFCINLNIANLHHIGYLLSEWGRIEQDLEGISSVTIGLGYLTNSSVSMLNALNLVKYP